MTETTPRNTLTSDISPYSATVTRSAACLNCGAGLSGQFCSQCGQRDIPPYPSTRELVVDAFWELSGWDGRFVSTVKALIQRPGMLTREFLEGRRARYLSPLRLYLLASLAFFLVSAAAPNLNGPRQKAGLQVGTTAKSRPERVANAAEASFEVNGLSAEERAATLKDIGRAPTLMRPFLRKVVGDPAGFKTAIREAMPRLLFALLPVFAAIVSLFYRGRKYPEHLYFAIHLHAFTFVVLALGELMKFTRSASISAAVGIIALLFVPVYSTLAFRRVYGGTLVRTLLKEVVIGAIYMTASIVAFIIMLYWVSIK